MEPPEKRLPPLRREDTGRGVFPSMLLTSERNGEGEGER